MAPVIVLRPGSRHFGLQTMADQLLGAFPDRTEALDPYQYEPGAMADAVRGRVVVSNMLDGVLPDFGEHIRAILDTAERVVWAPMSEYLLPRGAEDGTYRRFASILSPTRQATDWLTSRGLACEHVPWWVAPSKVRPGAGTERRILHFSYGLLGYYKSGTDLVLEAWPRLRDMGFSLTIKSRTPLDVPAGVRMVSDDLGSLDDLWAGHGVFLTPYRRAGIGLPAQEATARGLVALVTDRTAAAEFVPEAWRLSSEPDGGGRGLANWEREAGSVKDWERTTTPAAIVDALALLDGLRLCSYPARAALLDGHAAWSSEWERVLWP